MVERRYQTAVIAALLAIGTACTVSGPTATDARQGELTDTAPQSSSDTEEQPATSTGPQPGTSDRPPSADAKPAPATTVVDEVVAGIEIVSTIIEAGLNNGAVADVSDVATVDGETPTGIIVGSLAAARSRPEHATVWTIADQDLAPLALDDGGADASKLHGVATDGEHVWATGVVDIDGHGRPAVWWSTDGGTTFDGPDFPLEGPGSGWDVAFADGIAVVVSTMSLDDGDRLLVSRAEADGWAHVELPLVGNNASVTGIVEGGGVLLVAGWSEIDGHPTGAVWRSADAGRSFERIDDPAIATSTVIGPPSAGLDGYVATAARPADRPTVLLTSTDGVSWREIELSMDYGGTTRSGLEAGAGPLIALGGTLVIGMTDQWAALATVNRTGVGSYENVPFDWASNLFREPRPFHLPTGLHAVGGTGTLFVVAGSRSDRWFNVASAGEAWGADAAELFVQSTSNGLVLETRSFPEAEESGSGVRWWSGAQFFGREDDRWGSLGDMPVNASLASDGEVDLALVFTTDPSDSGTVGPTSGTAIAIRDGGSWSSPELVASGPGADLLWDAVRSETGLVAVGARYTRDVDGASGATPMIFENDGSAWVETVADLGLDGSAELRAVVAAGDGSIAASGVVRESGSEQALVVRRDASGIWRRLPIGTFADRPPLSDVVLLPRSTGVDVLGREPEAWVRYYTTDQTTERTAIAFLDAVRDSVVAAVEFDRRRFLVGVTERAERRTLAVWELIDEGFVSAVELREVPASFDLQVHSAAVEGGRLLIGGTSNHAYALWEIDLGDQ